jgi:hypothetical protein
MFPGTTGDVADDEDDGQDSEQPSVKPKKSTTNTKIRGRREESMKHQE